MLSAFFRAVADFRNPALSRMIAIGLALTVTSFLVLWGVLAVVVGHLSLFGSAYLNWLVDLLGAVAVLVLSWLLFPAVSTLVMGFFLDRIASAVEVANYPELGPARPVRATVVLAATARLMSLAILLNILVLPAYLLLPVANVFVFLAVNGYLFGREYFEVVALRRIDPILARQTRRRFALRLFLGGVLIAGVFAVPLVNLIAPVFATALMVHIFQALRPRDPGFITSSTR